MRCSYCKVDFVGDVTVDHLCRCASEMAKKKAAQKPGITCPHCHVPLTDEQLKRLHGQHMLSKRKTPPKSGPGRPKSKTTTP